MPLPDAVFLGHVLRAIDRLSELVAGTDREVFAKKGDVSLTPEERWRWGAGASGGADRGALARRRPRCLRESAHRRTRSRARQARGRSAEPRASEEPDFPRHLEVRLREALRDTPAALLHGARQSGKMTLAHSVGEARSCRYDQMTGASNNSASTNLS